MKTIKDMLSRLVLMCRLENAIVSELEKLAVRVYALEENRKLKDATIQHHTDQLQRHELILRQNNGKSTSGSNALDSIKL